MTKLIEYIKVHPIFTILFTWGVFFCLYEIVELLKVVL